MLHQVCHGSYQVCHDSYQVCHDESHQVCHSQCSTKCAVNSIRCATSPIRCAMAPIRCAMMNPIRCAIPNVPPSVLWIPSGVPRVPSGVPCHTRVTAHISRFRFHVGQVHQTSTEHGCRWLWPCWPRMYLFISFPAFVYTHHEKFIKVRKSLARWVLRRELPFFCQSVTCPALSTDLIHGGQQGEPLCRMQMSEPPQLYPTNFGMYFLCKMNYIC